MNITVSTYKGNLLAKIPFSLKDSFKEAVSNVKWQKETKEWSIPSESIDAFKAWRIQAESGSQINESSAKKNNMGSSFSEWKEEADIPMKDEDGNWYDAETGISFKDWSAGETKTIRKKVSVITTEYRKTIRDIGGSSLSGTMKQKEWAEKIRADKVKQLQDDQRHILVAAYKVFDKASFWIANRDKAATEIYNYAVSYKDVSNALNQLNNSILKMEKLKAVELIKSMTEIWRKTEDVLNESLEDINEIKSINVADLIALSQSSNQDVDNLKTIYQKEQYELSIQNSKNDLDKKLKSLVATTVSKDPLFALEKCRLVLRAIENLDKANKRELNTF
jgi:hypothetical protein